MPRSLAVHRLPLETRSPTVRLADAIHAAAVGQFAAEPRATGADLVAASVWSLALIVASVEDEIDGDGRSGALDAALTGLRRGVGHARQMARDLERVQ